VVEPCRSGEYPVIDSDETAQLNLAEDLSGEQTCPVQVEPSNSIPTSIPAIFSLAMEVSVDRIFLT